MKVEDALGPRKFGDAGGCTLDLDLTLATIRQAQPGPTLDDPDLVCGPVKKRRGPTSHTRHGDNQAGNCPRQTNPASLSVT